MSAMPRKRTSCCGLIDVCGGAIISLFIEKSSLQYDLKIPVTLCRAYSDIEKIGHF